MNNSQNNSNNCRTNTGSLDKNNREIRKELTINDITALNDDSNKFFSTEEMEYFSQDIPNIVSYMKSGMPFINYNIAKKHFENVIGSNYSIEVLNYEYIETFETFLVHLRITIYRKGKKIFKDVLGTETASHKKDSEEIINFKNLPKSAIKNGFKKFLTDYLGIGAMQYMSAKAKYEQECTSKDKNVSNPATQELLKCEDCGTTIDSKVHFYSTTIHTEHRPLCQKCQFNYR